jgi:hypothetical protein
MALLLSGILPGWWDFTMLLVHTLTVAYWSAPG